MRVKVGTAFCFLAIGFLVISMTITSNEARFSGLESTFTEMDILNSFFFGLILCFIGETLLILSMVDAIKDYRLNTTEIQVQESTDRESLDHRAKRVLDAIKRSGEVSFEGISDETGLSKNEVILAIHRLINQHTFRGTIKWRNEMISSTIVHEGDVKCPNCGANLSFESWPEATCTYCDSEVYLG